MPDPAAPRPETDTPTHVAYTGLFEGVLHEPEDYPRRFQVLHFRTFPARASPFNFLVRWELSRADLNASHTETLALTTGDGQVLRESVRTGFYGPREQTTVTSWWVTEMTFPAAGEYAMHISWDGIEVHQVPLSIRQCPPA